jgi:predicted SnoaL-like aldol condensation-catalyzing enzyme
MEANELLNNLAELLKEEMRQQLKIANHIMTGDLVESIESRILSTIEGRKIEIWLNSYGIALDQGVPADRIPFTEPSGCRDLRS